jgi:hypothetical protein
MMCRGIKLKSCNYCLKWQFLTDVITRSAAAAAAAKKEILILLHTPQKMKLFINN